MRSHLALLIYAVCHAIANHDKFHCNHDDVLHRDQHVVSPQQYAVPPHLRALSAHASSWSPLRVSTRVVPGSLAALDAANQTFLVNVLLPAAIGWLSSALSVVPITGQLLAARECDTYYDTTPPVCASAAQSTCGTTASSNAATIPSDLLASLVVCSTCFGQGCTSPQSLCQTLPAGQGVAADFVLMVSAVETSNCPGYVLAYASTCQRDQQDRPIMGQVNFCPSKV